MKESFNTFLKICLAGGLFEGGLFDDAPMVDVPVPDVSSITDGDPNAAALARGDADDSDNDMGDFGGPPSPLGGGMSSDGSRPSSPVGAEGATHDERAASVMSKRFATPAPSVADDHGANIAEEAAPLQDQTTLLHDEEESFALAPIDATALKG